jgi:hypothetical protein
MTPCKHVDFAAFCQLGTGVGASRIQKTVIIGPGCWGNADEGLVDQIGNRVSGFLSFNIGPAGN